MTREEAIADIRDNIKPVVGGISLDMAIKSLEAWEKVKTELKAEKKKYLACGLIGSASGVSRSMKIIDKHLSEVSE